MPLAWSSSSTAPFLWVQHLIFFWEWFLLPLHAILMDLSFEVHCSLLDKRWACNSSWTNYPFFPSIPNLQWTSTDTKAAKTGSSQLWWLMSLSICSCYQGPQSIPGSWSPFLCLVLWPSPYIWKFFPALPNELLCAQVRQTQSISITWKLRILTEIIGFATIRCRRKDLMIWFLKISNK